MFNIVLIIAVIRLAIILFTLIFVYTFIKTLIAYSIRLYKAKKRQTTALEIENDDHK